MIKIICVGKVKQDWIGEAIAQYETYLSKYTKVTWIECKEADSSLPKEKRLEEEARSILKHIDDTDKVFLLSEHGTTYDSPAFAKLLEIEVDQGSHMTWIIGGTFGLGEQLYKRAEYLVSLSPLTFPHLMCRVIFLEQLFRAFTIMKSSDYHY